MISAKSFVWRRLMSGFFSPFIQSFSGTLLRGLRFFDMEMNQIRKHHPQALILACTLLTLLIVSCSSATGEQAVMTLSSGASSIQARYIQLAIDPVKYETEYDNRYEYPVLSFNVSETALILIDVWDRSWCDGYGERANRNVEEKLIPALDHARTIGMTVIHSHHLSDGTYGLNPNISFLPGEYVIDGPNEQAELTNLLLNKGIKLIFYAGYATNMCVLHRPSGIEAMHKRGFNIVILRDATEAVELPSVYPMGTMRDAAVTSIEMMHGWSATVEDFTGVQ